MDGKILYHLKKEKSKKEILFVENLSMDKTGWFISVRILKSGKFDKEHCIIKKDIPVWVDSYIRLGWQNILNS